MEIAVHLRDPSQVQDFKGVPGHLTALYEAGTLEEAKKSVPRRIRRLYVGDEFCLNRLPSVKEMDGFLGMARARNWPVTLLTPPLTDEGLEECVPLFSRLAEDDPGTEVVVNDWGALLFLKERYPGFRLATGRLLNKAFKDPRLLEPERFQQLSQEAADLLNGCTFDSLEFQEEMRRLGVKRLERDLLPYGSARVKSPEGLGVSVYFPFGYVTTGRVCWIASFHRSGREKFSLGKSCDRLCSRLSLKLNSPDSRFELFQAGNGIFYPYPASALAPFLNWAKRRRIRLVYQGLAI